MKLPTKRRREAAFDPTVPAGVGQPTAITTADFRFCTLSDFYCEVLQRGREELLNCDWQTIVHPADLTNPRAKHAALLATGESYEVQCRVRRGDGKWLLGHFRASRIMCGRGNEPMVQASAWFEHVPELSLPLPFPESKAALAEYIQAITTELAKLAGQHRLSMLQHLLSMASLEAADELQRHLADLTDYPERLS